MDNRPYGTSEDEQQEIGKSINFFPSDNEAYNVKEE